MTAFRNGSLALASLVLLAVVLAGCDSTGMDTAQHPPDVLPPTAFELNTDLFSNQNPGSSSATKTGAYAHFANAALRVWPVSALVKANLIIPSAVTAGALQADPVIEEGTWVWDATVDSLDQDVTFRLEGTPDGDRVLWSMFVTAPNPAQGQALDNFELYTAQTAMDGSSGSWSLYYHLDGERTRVLDADFTVTSDTTKEVTFSVPGTADENAGDSVRYAVDGSQRTFEWTRVEDVGNTVVRATWDADTKAGSLVAPNYNGGEPACWDETFQNVPCVN